MGASWAVTHKVLTSIHASMYTHHSIAQIKKGRIGALSQTYPLKLLHTLLHVGRYRECLSLEDKLFLIVVLLPTSGCCKMHSSDYIVWSIT